MRLYGLSNCNDNISETISLGEVLCQYIRLGTATTCRQKLSIGGALDSMREQWMANSATAPLSASDLPVLNECIDLDYETHFPYNICTNRSLLLRFLPVSHRKEDHEMVLTLHNLSRDIVRHTIESETFTEERHVLIGQKEADLCSSIVIPFMLAGKNN